MHFIARIYLFFSGWRAEGSFPDAQKVVLIAAPHTSNWDLPHMLAIGFYLRLGIHWLGKREMFVPPFVGFFRWLGGLPVNRKKNTKMVDSIVQLFDERERLVLVVPPEGTRRQSEFWKSGFYHIAASAGVPIVCGFLDYSRKRGGFGPAIMPSGDMGADMDRIREFYKSEMGKYPDRFQVPRLREEGSLPQAEASGP